MKEDYQFKGCWIKGPDRDYGQDDSLYYQDQRNTVVLKQFSIRDNIFIYCNTWIFNYLYQWTKNNRR